jgi:hypothetical protein
MPVTLATREAEIRRIEVPFQPPGNKSETLSQKIPNVSWAPMLTPVIQAT